MTPSAPSSPRQVVVTRPEPDASQWVAQLQARGCEAQALPLIDIGRVPWDFALQRRMAQLHEFSAVMWVSGNAVTRFFERHRSPWPSHTRCWAPGPGTARALRAAGVPADLIDAPMVDAVQFDSQNLWPAIAPQVRAGVRILVMRGRDQGPAGADAGVGRDWLLERCRASGAVVEEAIVYERTCPQWDAPTVERAQRAARDHSVWLFSSAQAAQHLRALLPGVEWSTVPAVATHPRIAQALVSAGFVRVTTSRPTLDEIWRTLESLWKPS